MKQLTHVAELSEIRNFAAQQQLPHLALPRQFPEQ
jgi:hypothetical protein